VQQVREDGLAERVVAEVLNDAAAVCVGVGLLQLERREVRKTLEQQRLNGVGPGEVNDLLMRENRVRAGWLGKGEQESEDENRRQNKLA
jgi:hypothetical protein